MKKIISLISCTVLLFSLSSCSVEKTPMLDNSDQSYFVDFYTDDDYVYIECVLNIYNPNNTESEVKSKTKKYSRKNRKSKRITKRKIQKETI